jgi:hypothetical protein
MSCINLELDDSLRSNPKLNVSRKPILSLLFSNWFEKKGLKVHELSTFLDIFYIDIPRIIFNGY